jgi:hypothetical protein
VEYGVILISPLVFTQLRGEISAQAFTSAVTEKWRDSTTKTYIEENKKQRGKMAQIQYQKQ